MNRERIYSYYCMEAIRRLTELRSAAEEAEISAGAIDFTDEMEEEPFQWISLTRPAHSSLTYRPKVQDSSAEPYQRMAGLLELLQENLPDAALQMQGMTTLIRDKRAHFCISGSISLASLQTLCEHCEEPSDHLQKKVIQQK